MGIWRNIGKIVSLSFEIVHEEMKWIVHSWTWTKPIPPKKKVNNIYHSMVDSIYESLDEEQESLERVEWSENPHYEN